MTKDYRVRGWRNPRSQQHVDVVVSAESDDDALEKAQSLLRAKPEMWVEQPNEQRVSIPR